MIHKGVWFIAVLAAILLAGGLWAIIKKKSVVDQIKIETVTPAVLPRSTHDPRSPLPSPE
jgi:hypothetical protein